MKAAYRMATQDGYTNACRLRTCTRVFANWQLFLFTLAQVDNLFWVKDIHMIRLVKFVMKYSCVSSWWQVKLKLSWWPCLVWLVIPTSCSSSSRLKVRSLHCSNTWAFQSIAQPNTSFAWLHAVTVSVWPRHYTKLCKLVFPRSRKYIAPSVLTCHFLNTSWGVAASAELFCPSVTMHDT